MVLKIIQKLKIVSGGKERIDSIQNVINGISELSTSDDDVIIMHDAVRPLYQLKFLKIVLKQLLNTVHALRLFLL